MGVDDCVLLGDECWVMGVDDCILLGDECWVMGVDDGYKLFIMGDDANQMQQFINIHHSTPTTQLNQFVNSKLACARQVTSGPFSGLSSR